MSKHATGWSGDTYTDLHEDGSYTIITKNIDGIIVRRMQYDASGKLIDDDTTTVPPKTYTLPQTHTYNDKLSRVESFLLMVIEEEDPRRQNHRMKSALYHLEKMMDMKNREELSNDIVACLQKISTQYDLTKIIDTADEYEDYHKALIFEELVKYNRDTSEEEVNRVYSKSHSKQARDLLEDVLTSLQLTRSYVFFENNDDE